MNEAKKLLESIGLPVGETKKQAHGDKNASATKSGPGRYHKVGHEKDRPASSKGAPAGFALHQATPARKQRRELLKTFGRRQVLRALKTQRRLQNEAAPEYAPSLEPVAA